jgi:hypothetical protein
VTVEVTNQRQRTTRCSSFTFQGHGSSYNWYKGLAGSVQPALSVFSSDPDRGGKMHRSHPHSEVWNDFAPTGRAKLTRIAGSK